jgi:DNA-binding NtrC family response regulator
MGAECESPTGILPASYKQPSIKKAYRMAVVRGPSAGTHRLIDTREFRIGKAPANHLSLSDPTVSRFHCVVEYTPRGLLLRDLGSTNGTQVAGCWVERAYLTPLVPIQVGSTTLQVMTVDSKEEAPPVPEASYDTKMLGSSPAIQRLLASLPRVASSGATVLLEGETGTGKSLLAEIIHQSGPRPEAPFIIVDCGAIPPNLIESELFGHERGAFTGAVDRRMGAFEAAHGGTIFLDEIGELPLAMQPKLLRALEERTIKRIGSTKPVRVETQVIAATNRDLREAVTRGDFRADLYYRLDALRLRLPPLRERREDIPQLIEQFAVRVRPDLDAGGLATLKHTLAAHSDWPGNIRELRNAVEKAILLGDLSAAGGTPPGGIPPVTIPSLTGPFDAGLSFRAAKDQAVAEWEASYLRSLLKHAKGNLSQAARMVQMDRSHLRDLLRRYQIVGN